MPYFSALGERGFAPISVALSRDSHCYRTILPTRITSNLQFAKCPLFRAFNAP